MLENKTKMKLISIGIVDGFGNRSKQSLSDYFKGLDGKDRRNLTDILISLRTAGISKVIIGGSSALGKGYNDIDIGFQSRGNSYIDHISKLGASIKEIKVNTGEEPTYLGRDEKYYAKAYVKYNGTEFDLTIYERLPILEFIGNNIQ